MQMNKCDICGKKLPEKEIFVSASAYGPESFAYCRECLLLGLEPYEHLVSYFAPLLTKCPNKVSDEQKNEINRILGHLNKTEAEFFDDCKKLYE